MKVDYRLVSFILRGKRRKAVLKTLDNPKIPKEIAAECRISIHNVSNTLTELMNKKIVKCLNPEDKLFRYYILTKKGKILKKKLIS
jgi:predicted transcriptional regulator